MHYAGNVFHQHQNNRLHWEDTTQPYSWNKITHNQTTPVSASTLQRFQTRGGDALQVRTGQFQTASKMEQAAPLTVMGEPSRTCTVVEEKLLVRFIASSFSHISYISSVLSYIHLLLQAQFPRCRATARNPQLHSTPLTLQLH